MPERIIFSHGLGQTGEDWRKTASFLPPGYECEFPELAEMCGSTPDYGTLYRSFSEYCGSFPGSLHLCGLSLGGMLALNFTVEHPEKVRSLVLIGTRFKSPKALLLVQDIIFRIMPEQTFGDTGFDKKGFMLLTRSMTSLDFSVAAGKISCPVMVICGEKDSANKKASVAMSGSIPNARLDIVSGAGHEVNKDSPEALASLLKKFYTGVYSS